MSPSLFFDNKKYISAKEASSITGYSKDYIGQLARANKIDSKRISRIWYVGEESLLNYKNFSNKLGLLPESEYEAKNQKHLDESRVGEMHQNSPFIDKTDKKISGQEISLVKKYQLLETPKRAKRKVLSMGMKLSLFTFSFLLVAGVLLLNDINFSNTVKNISSIPANFLAADLAKLPTGQSPTTTQPSISNLTAAYENYLSTANISDLATTYENYIAQPAPSARPIIASDLLKAYKNYIAVSLVATSLPVAQKISPVVISPKTKAVPPKTPAPLPAPSALSSFSDAAIISAIEKVINQSSIAAKLRGPVGPQGPAGSNAMYSGQPVASIQLSAPAPIPVVLTPVGISQPDPAHNFSGASYFTATNLSSNTLTAGGANITDLTISGSSVLKGNLTVAGDSTFAGNLNVAGVIISPGAITIGTAVGSVNTFGSGASSVNIIGSTITPGTLTLHGPTTLDNTFSQTGANTFSTGTGAVSLNGDTTVAADKNFTQNGTGTFSTGTGAVSLNGATSVTGTNTFTVGTGLATFGANISLTAASPIINSTAGTLSVNTTNNQPVIFGSGLVTANNFGSSSVAITGGTINNTAVGVTTPAAGNFTTIGITTPGTSAFTTLTSSGNTTLGTGASLTNTFGTGTGAANTIGVSGGTNAINGSTTILGTILINSTGTNSTTIGNSTGTLTFHGATTLDNTFSQTGANTFSTGTGAISLNGDVTLATGKTLNTTGRVALGYIPTSITDYTLAARPAATNPTNRFLYNGSYTDIPIMMGLDTDLKYYGYTNKFTGVYLTFSTLGIGYNLVVEYSKGGVSWGSVSVTDETSNLTTNGSIYFSPPSDWATATVNSVSDIYWIRLSTPLSSPTQTAITSQNSILPAGYAFATYLGPSDTTPKFYVDYRGNVQVTTLLIAQDLSVIRNVISHLIPGTNNDYNIGSGTNYWKTGYITTLNANNIIAANTEIAGTKNETFTLNSDNNPANPDQNIVFSRTTGQNPEFGWNNGLGTFTLNGPLALSAGTGTTATFTLPGNINTTGGNIQTNSTPRIDNAGNLSNIGTYTSSLTPAGVTAVDLIFATLTNGTDSGTQRLLTLTNAGTGTTEDGIYVNNTGVGVTALEIAGAWTNGIITNNNSINAGSGTITAATFVGALSGNATTATTLASSRNLWGQAFNGSGDITGSLTSVGDITGGASSMTITAGTGNSRTLTLQTTTSGGTATAFLTGNADQSATFANTVNATTFTGALTGHASLDLPLTGGTLTGALLFTDNSYDIGASAATRPRTGYFGTSLVAPTINATTALQINGATVLSGSTLGSSITASSLTSLGTLTGLTVNSATITLSQDTNFVLSGGVNGVSFNTDTLSIDATNGRVGIGTTGPDSALTIDKVTFPRIRIYENGVSKVQLGHGNITAGVSELVTTGAHNLGLGTNTAINVTIQSGGNVGIGTAGPQEKLALSSGSNFATEMAVPTGVGAVCSDTDGSLAAGTYYFKATASHDSSGTTSTTGSAEASCIVTAGTTGSATISWTAPTGAAGFRVYKGTASGGQDRYFVDTASPYIYTTDTGATLGSVPTTTNAYVSKLAASGNSWLNGGNVGIGTTVPTGKLEIVAGLNQSAKIVVGVASNFGLPADAANLGAGLALSRPSDGVYTSGMFVINTNDVGFTSRSNYHFYDAGVEKVTILENGNVGIGTTSPGAVLQVKGTAGSNIFQIVNSTGNTAFTIDNSNLNAQFYTGGGIDQASLGFLGTTGLGYSSGKLSFITGSASKMVLDTSGNVGIGTTNPGAKLEIGSGQVFLPNGSATAPALSFTNDSNTGFYWATGIDDNILVSTAGALRSTFNSSGFSQRSDNYLRWTSSSDPTSGGDLTLTRDSAATLQLGVDHATTPTGQTIKAHDVTTGTGASLTLNGGTGSVANGAVVLQPTTGNVGIGTTAPEYKLDVYAGASGRAEIHNDNGGDILDVNSTVSGTPSIRIAPAGASSNAAKIKGVLNGTNTDLVFFTGGSERVRFDMTGNVGIGTTTPGALLDLGTAGSKLGVIRFAGSSSGNVTMQPAAIAGTWTLTLPATTGSSGQFLQTDGTGITTWATVSSTPAWSVLTNPAGPLALTMGANTSTFTYNATTGTANLFNLTDTASNTGTGYLFNLTTASGSALNPFHVSAAGTEAITVLANGMVGIGTTAPSGLLHVKGTSASAVLVADASANTIFQVDTTQTATNGGLDITAGIDQTGNLLALYSSGGTLLSNFDSNGGLAINIPSISALNILDGSGSSAFMVDSLNDYIGIGTATPAQALDVTGTIRQSSCKTAGTLSANTSGDIICTPSSLRFKENIADSESGLSNILALRPVSYTFNPDMDMGNENRFGFIAEEVASISPEFATYDSSGNPYGLDTNAILAAAVNAIKELNLNLEAVAGTTTPLPGSPEESFATAFFKNMFAKITTWLADATNGISNVFAQTITVHNANVENLCVSDATGAKTCITKAQLDSLLAAAGGSVINNVGSPSTPSTPPAETPPQPSPEANQPVVEEGAGQPLADSTPPPAETPPPAPPAETPPTP